MIVEDDLNQCHDESDGENAADGRDCTLPEPSRKEERSVARICGSSRSKCGYCGGKRLHVLSVQDEYNEAAYGVAPNGLDQNETKIDETNTSKSYGLLFDCIPYDTYEVLINRGWRRSGKHLYRPHNFESCCPAISIRLDVSEFASHCNASASTGKESDLARSVLVNGSKSQRKVGKKISRALEFYNSKSTGDSNGCVAELGNGVTTLHSASGVAKTKHRDCSQHHGKTQPVSEPMHLNKKSRRRSPDRDNEKIEGSSAIVLGALSADALGQKFDHFDEVSLQSILDNLSLVVYQTITKEAMKAVDSSKTGQPRWAWWKDGVGGDGIIPKWSSFKVLQPRSGEKIQLQANADGVSVAASTSACVAASGRSRGDISKSHFIQSVVESLKNAKLSFPNNEDLRFGVKEVSAHEKSCQVCVRIFVPLSAVTPREKHQQLSEKEKINCASNKRIDGLDPIADYIKRYQANAMKLNHLNEHICAQKVMAHQKRYLTVRSVPAHESSLQLEVHQLFCRYQAAVHGDSDPFFGAEGSLEENHQAHDYNYYRKQNLPGFLDIDIAYNHLGENQRLQIKGSYLTFYRFLCDTPVTQDEIPYHLDSLYDEDGYDIHIPFGTYHQQYRLSTSKEAFDGPLVAVGVVDILPQSVSSVYAFYDPILSSKLELGKYTALREIEWVRRASHFRPDLHFYYLGYYIHSCQKMTYKAEYKPSELLCPVTLKWVRFEDAKKRLEECSPIRHCCALYDGPPLDPITNKSKSMLDDITLDISGGYGTPHLVQFRMLNKSGKEHVGPHVSEFASEVGLDLCPKFIIKLG
ncbi:hypothetical protein ACHAWF_008277 [Thalassiosira exigua]